MPSVFSSPNPILFGRGAAAVVGDKLREFGCSRVLVVYDKGVEAAGVAATILGHLHAAHIQTVCFDGVLPDPPDTTVDQAGALGVAEGVDGIVGVGGGSSLDTAKGACLLLTNPGPIGRYYARPDAPPPAGLQPLKPIVVIPTTSGTGSEATPGGVITDTQNHRKQIIICPVSLAIVDPELTVGLPSAITAATAFDALCHAAEALTSAAPNAFGRVLGKEAITLISRALPLAYDDGGDIEAREQLQLAATLAAMSILGPFCHIPHELGQPLGSLFGIPHGLACAATLAESMRFVAPGVPEQVRLVAECMGPALSPGATADQVGQAAYGRIYDLRERVELPSLASFVPDKQQLLAAVPHICQVSPFVFSPVAVRPSDVTTILEQAYAGRVESAVAP